MKARSGIPPIVIAVVLTAAVSVNAGTATARKPAEMRFACAEKRGGALSYAPRRSACSPRQHTLNLGRSLITTCVSRDRVRRVTRSTGCRAPNRVRVLPDTRKRFFCAAPRTRRLRPVSSQRRCTARERPVVVSPRPLARNDAAATDEERAIDIAVLANDRAARGRLSVHSLDTRGMSGTASINADGSVRYDPGTSQGGGDTFRYRARDRRGISFPATVTVTVNGVNDAPSLSGVEAETLAYVTDAPKPVSPGIAVADADSQNLAGASVRITSGHNSATDELQFQNQSGITGTYNSGTGVLTLTGSAAAAQYQSALRSVSFRATDSASGTREVAFQVDDGTAQSNTPARRVSIDQGPQAVDDNATITEDSGANSLDVLANDTDSDGGPRTIESTSDPAHGTVVITGAGSGLTYEPDPDYCNAPGADTFTYTLVGGSQATVSVTVNCVNDPPRAVDDSATVAEDSGATSIPVLANDRDPEGDFFGISSATDPAHGTVVLTGFIGFSFQGLSYQPDPDYCNSEPGGTPDTFTYTISGGSQATVSMTVTCEPG